MRAMAKIQIMQVPVIGFLLGKAGVFGVDRGHADMKAVKTALRFLKNGDKLLMFPEGTRVHEGEDVSAKTGAAMFATRTGAPLSARVHPAPESGCSAVTCCGRGAIPRPPLPGSKPTARGA